MAFGSPRSLGPPRRWTAGIEGEGAPAPVALSMSVKFVSLSDTKFTVIVMSARFWVPGT